MNVSVSDSAGLSNSPHLRPHLVSPVHLDHLKDFRRVIDKLDLKIPAKARPTREFGRVLLHAERSSERWNTNRYYERSTSFVQEGYPVILHMHCKHGDGAHKLEFVGTGEMNLMKMEDMVDRMFDTDTRELGIMRLDLTADVQGTPVKWFKDHTLVQRKQIRREIGLTSPEPYSTVHQGRAQTLYAGKKPNQMRIYDKTAERFAHHMKWVRKQIRAGVDAADLPSFQDVYGYSEDTIITRVERQVHGRDIERLGIQRMGQLGAAANIHPFTQMVFLTPPREQKLLTALRPERRLAVLHMRSLVQQGGLDYAREWMRTQYSQPTHFYRAWKVYRDFLATPKNIVGIDAKRLQEEFRASTLRQLLRVA